MPAVVDVSLRGSESLSHVDSDDVNAYIDAAGLGAGDYMLAVHASAPEQAGVTHIDPAAVQVRITSAKN
jgi:YbbR domain-containing protein